MLNQMVAVAELEAGLISARTKAALRAAKARGQVLGGNRGTKITKAAGETGRAAATARAADRSADLAPAITAIRQAGITSASGIAKALNERGIPTARGGEWQAVQVQRVIAVWPQHRMLSLIEREKNLRDGGDWSCTDCDSVHARLKPGYVLVLRSRQCNARRTGCICPHPEAARNRPSVMKRCSHCRFIIVNGASRLSTA